MGFHTLSVFQGIRNYIVEEFGSQCIARYYENRFYDHSVVAMCGAGHCDLVQGFGMPAKITVLFEEVYHATFVLWSFALVPWIYIVHGPDVVVSDTSGD